MTASINSVEALFDYAAANPDGFTYRDIEADLGWPRNYFFKVARRFRLHYGEDDLNLVCEPQGAHDAWLYRLVGSLDGTRQWTTIRLGDMESRLQTVLGVARSVVNSSDGRSLEGRKARKIANTVGYLLTELGDMDMNGGIG